MIFFNRQRKESQTGLVWSKMEVNDDRIFIFGWIIYKLKKL